MTAITEAGMVMTGSTWRERVVGNRQPSDTKGRLIEGIIERRSIRENWAPSTTPELAEETHHQQPFQSCYELQRPLHLSQVYTSWFWDV